jgi:hypothetical protein
MVKNKKFLNPNYALGFDEEPQNRDAERLEGFAGHTNCGMDKKPENLYAREIVVMRKVLMHNLGCGEGNRGEAYK